jgi:hypothetical protein
LYCVPCGFWRDAMSELAMAACEPRSVVIICAVGALSMVEDS